MVHGHIAYWCRSASRIDRVTASPAPGGDEMELEVDADESVCASYWGTLQTICPTRSAPSLIPFWREGTWWKSRRIPLEENSTACGLVGIAISLTILFPQFHRHHWRTWIFQATITKFSSSNTLRNIEQSQGKDPCWELWSTAFHFVWKSYANISKEQGQRFLDGLICSPPPM